LIEAVIPVVSVLSRAAFKSTICLGSRQLKEATAKGSTAFVVPDNLPLTLIRSSASSVVVLVRVERVRVAVASAPAEGAVAAGRASLEETTARHRLMAIKKRNRRNIVEG
jgi:hypothetical protein